MYYLLGREIGNGEQVALFLLHDGRVHAVQNLDPYSGALLAKPQGQDFFRSVMQLHRWILLPGGSAGAGRQIVGAATLILIYLAISGLYLRWPKRHSLKTWLKIDLMWSSPICACPAWMALSFLRPLRKNTRTRSASC